MSWVPTSFLLAATVALLPMGRLADIYGRKRTYALGFALLTAASLISGLSFSASMLLIGRALQGIGSAMIFATGLAIISSVFPLGERGRALGITVSAVYTGLSFGPFLGGILTHHLTWRSIFFAVALLGVGAVALIVRKLKGEWAEAEGESFDYVGSLIYGASISAMMIGISLLPDIRSLWLIPPGILGLLLFAAWEARIASPVFDVRLFRGNRVFALSSLAALINYSATFSVTFLMSLYLQYIKGLGPQSTGVVLVAQPLMMAVFSPFSGKLSDKVEPRIVASLGMALTATGLFIFTFLSQDATFAAIVSNLLLLGLGFALFSSPNMNAIMSSVDKKHYGIASGAVGTMRLVGQTLSMGVTASFFALYIGEAQITAEFYPAFLKALRMTFMVSTALCIGGVFASLTRGKLRGNGA